MLWSVSQCMCKVQLELFKAEKKNLLYCVLCLIYIYMSFIFCTGVTSHYYQVSFSPVHSTEDPTNEEKQQDYVKLYSSRSFRSYIKVHERTIASSKCKNVVDIKYIQTEKMLDNVQNHYLSEHVVDYAMGPLRVYNPDAGDFLQMKVQDENVKNKFFAHFVSFCLPKCFRLGLLTVPVKKAYSKYGKSRQDMCVFHENYLSPKAAVLSWVEPPSTDTEALHFSCGEANDATFDVFDFKNKGYAEQQAAKEMMCAAGNLTAKVLSIGSRPGNVIIYGIAGDYDTKEGKLLVLQIDFCNNTAHTYCSDSVTSICDGFNWMLSGISPNSN